MIHTYCRNAILSHTCLEGRGVNTDLCWGISEEHIDFCALEKPVHKSLVIPLCNLKKQAKTAGFELCIASGFRSFQRQLEIWNAKARGERTVLNNEGRPLQRLSVSKTELMFAMLRWSALPGASRHHWGSDVDIYDAKAISPSNLQLLPCEYQESGPCAALHRWLRSHLQADQFFWPYCQDLGGVAPEPWHLSYRPIAQSFEQSLTIDGLAQLVESAPIELKKEIMQNLDVIFRKYTQSV